MSTSKLRHAIPGFAYKPLSSVTSIRLVTLRQGYPDDPLDISLNHADLQTAYEALSYEWGCERCDDPIVHIDRHPGYVLRIRRNLYDALCHIRLEDRARYLWVDALCINQIDQNERSHQVQLMGKIYAGAKLVIVWLGMTDDRSDHAMKLLQTQVCEENRKHDGSFFGEKERLSDHHLHAIHNLSTRSYWHRVWIRQELYFAKALVVYCGSQYIEESVLQTTYESSKGPEYNIILEHLRTRYERSRDRDMTLYRLVQSNLDLEFRSTEPRDFIYAVIGMASDCQNGEIPVDYQIPLQELFWQVFELCDISKPGFFYGKPKCDDWESRQFALGLAAEFGLLERHDHDALETLLRNRRRIKITRTIRLLKKILRRYYGDTKPVRSLEAYSGEARKPKLMTLQSVPNTYTQ